MSAKTLWFYASALLGASLIWTHAVNNLHSFINAIYCTSEGNIWLVIIKEVYGLGDPMA